MKKILLTFISFFIITSSCFAGVTGVGDKYSENIETVKKVSITNDSLNQASLMANITVLSKSLASTFKTILQGVLIIFLVYTGVQMIISMGTNEERLSGAKKQLYYALTGLLFINIPDILVGALMRGKVNPDTGEFVGNNDGVSLNSDLNGFTGGETSLIVNDNFAGVVGGNIISFMEVVVFGSAIFMFTIAGIKVIKSRGSEEDLNEGKFKFSYGLAGLFFVGLMEVYKNVVFNNDLFGGEKLYEQLVQVGAYFLAPVAFFFINLGGYYYIISGGDETRMKKGKDIILYTLFGILVYLASWSILAELNF